MSEAEPEKLRTVYLVEVLETPDQDGQLKVYGNPKDADQAVERFREQGRRARTWPESVLWS